MSRPDDVAGRWFDRQLGRTDRADLSAWSDRLMSGRTVNGMPALLSYGPHFPLVVYVGKGKRRRGGPLLVLNGDRWSGGWGTTNRHQSIVRQLADESGLEQCLIPFSALTAAGIDISTIEVRDRRPDTTWEEERESAHLSDVPRWKQQESYLVPRSADRLEDVPSNHRRHSWFDDRGRRYEYLTVDGQARLVSECGTITREPRAEGMQWREWAPQDETGRYTWEETRHRDVSPGADGIYRWTQSFHRLGDCLFSAETEHSRTVTRTNEQGEHLTRRETVRRRAVFVSSFDTNEPAPLYFLAEVPRSAGARTVEQAIDALAPRAVHAAIAQGRKVYRQGDVFAIETPLTDDEIRERTVTRARLTQWTRGARAKTGETGHVEPLTAAERRRWSRATVRRYHEIRAVDMTVRPSGKRGSWGARPGSFRTERDTYRHYGDHAALALDRARRETRPARMRPVDRETIRGAVAIYGTAHAATEVVTARGGATYCRGVLRQVPDLEPGRDSIRDHIPVTLGDGQTWFLAVRNTVPARADGTAVGGPLR